MVLGALALLTELAALGILAAWGWMARGWPLLLVAPLAFAVVWGLWLAPKARLKPAPALRLGLKVVLFALVTLAAARVWAGWVPWAFGLAAGLSLLAEFFQPRPA